MTTSAAAPRAKIKPDQLKALGVTGVLAKTRTSGSVNREAKELRNWGRLSCDGDFGVTLLTELLPVLAQTEIAVVLDSGNFLFQGGSLKTLT